MKTLFPMNGIITTVLTPFTTSLEVDWESFRRNIYAALDGGVSGFLVPCFASELKMLSQEERIKMVKETVSIAKGKALIISNIMADNSEERIYQSKSFMELGVDGLNLNMPYENEKSYIKMVAEIDSLNPNFMCIQDDSNDGNDIPVAFIKKIFEEFESFRCIKIETKNSGPKYTEVLRATNGLLNVSGAWGSDQMIEAYDRGIHALMPSGLYELFSEIYNLYHKKNRDSAMRLFFDMIPIIMFTRQSDEVNRTFHKTYLNRLGIFETALSREKGGFDKYHKRYADELIDYAIKLKENVQLYWE